MQTDAAKISGEIPLKSVKFDGNLKMNQNESLPPKNVNVYDQENYKMNHKNRGIALVINMYQFRNNLFATRSGSKEDVKSLEDVFGNHLGFQVITADDLTRVELSAKIDEVLQIDHTDNDSLVVVMMTHGKSNGVVAASDGVFELREIWDKFKGHKSLLGKPKLFFVQACRGINVTKGIDIPNQLVPDAENNTISIPEFADNLVMYSTCSDTISIRENETGTWFIQELCNQLKNNFTSDLLSVLTVVSRKIALKNGVIELNGEFVQAKQLPITMTSLTKKIYFHGQKTSCDGEEKLAVLPNVNLTKAQSGMLGNFLPLVAFVGFTLFSLIRK